MIRSRASIPGGGRTLLLSIDTSLDWTELEREGDQSAASDVQIKIAWSHTAIVQRVFRNTLPLPHTFLSVAILFSAYLTTLSVSLAV
jgi:hypothetical protein